MTRHIIRPCAVTPLTTSSYVLFSIGNVKPLYSAAFPNCWDTKKPQSKLVCDKEWLRSIEYLEVIGIIVGQILVGFVGDWYVLIYAPLIEYF